MSARQYCSRSLFNLVLTLFLAFTALDGLIIGLKASENPEFELKLWLNAAPAAVGGPTSGPRMIAEWEPALGTLIRWPLGIPFSVVRELASDDLLYTLVSGPGAEADATYTFSSEGVNLDNVVFIHTPIWSMWTRDWGPQGVFDDEGVLGYADPWFNGYPWVGGCYLAAAGEEDLPEDPMSERSGRSYAIDDAIPAAVAAFLGVPLHPLQAYLTGGNIMTDGLGIAWSTEQMFSENAPHMNLGTFLQRVEDATGIDDYRFVIDPEWYGIQHIDCYAKLLDEETVLVKQVPAAHREYACCEALADAFANALTCYGRPYNVVRIWCPPYSGNHVAAYTNSLILNRKVLVPLFNLSSDEGALQTYRDAMPGYDVYGFPWHAWYSYDALHCRTMGIFDPEMLRLLHARLDALVPGGQPHAVAAYIDARSEKPLVTGAQQVRWRLTGETSWHEAPLVNVALDSFVAHIPAQPAGSEVEYYLTASDVTGRTAVLPRGAPDGFYQFTVDEFSSVPPALASVQLAARPNPFNPRTELIVNLPSAERVNLRIHDTRGRLVAELLDGAMPAGDHAVTWDGVDQRGTPLPSGVYLARLRVGSRSATCKLVLAR